jgi:thioredoxin reductase
MRLHEVAIIGAGPAGLAAAIQLRRYGLDFILLERDEAGGLLRNANLVENYPGFPQGIPGPALVERLRYHMQLAGVQAVQAEVTGLAYQEGVFELNTQMGEVYAQVLVVASGTKPRRFTEFEIPESLRGEIFYEVHTLTHLTGQNIVIVGAGDAAFDYALNLARQNQVTILNRGDCISCLPLLWDRVRQTPNIAYHSDTHLLGLEVGRSGELRLKCDTPNGNVRLEADFLIGAMGREPQRDYISPEFETISKELTMQGLLYWVGDVQNDRYRQTSIAVGDGVKAAMQIYQNLKEISR